MNAEFLVLSPRSHFAPPWLFPIKLIVFSPRYDTCVSPSCPSWMMVERERGREHRSIVDTLVSRQLNVRSFLCRFHPCRQPCDTGTYRGKSRITICQIDYVTTAPRCHFLVPRPPWPKSKASLGSSVMPEVAENGIQLSRFFAIFHFMTALGR